MKTLFLALLLTVGGAALADGATIYSHNFGGSNAAPLHGVAPDVDNNGGTNAWAAYSGFKADGTYATNIQRGAFLPFTPAAGNVYALDASFSVNLSASNTWVALGFAKTVPANVEGAINRFVEGDSIGRAWTLIRTTTAVNQQFVGGGTAGASNWAAAGPSGGGSYDVRIVLDTTAPTYTATFYAKRPADVAYTQVSSGALNLTAADIGAVGFAQNNGAVTAKISKFSLTSIPEPASLTIGIGGIMAVVAASRRRK
ncbi:hypothetical protein [Lacipirellula parvula]|uniref:PEP-CTERM protein-sorting domain-containing protein n=1 Tax=Lacipirellula parvula TaxID=2650471 RepID=A0A5K7X2X2_9BACT|nr:hypothetical protein [Lacipirellula parvula]BBO30820.1 hypothetical protein PLANPX_0432 [Lacipirellula parvula]